MRNHPPHRHRSSSSIRSGAGRVGAATLVACLSSGAFAAPAQGDVDDSSFDTAAMDLRPVRGPAASLTDTVVEVKPDDASQLRIRLYDSTTGRQLRSVGDLPQGSADGSGASDDMVPTPAAAAWWALETRLSSRRVPGHTLLFGNDLRVTPAGSSGSGSVGADAAGGRTSTFVEDRTTLWSAVTVSTGLKQVATDLDARSFRSWLAMEARPRDGMTVRYVQGDVGGSAPAGTDAVAPTRPVLAADGRSVGPSAAPQGVVPNAGQSVAIEQQASSTDRWTVSAFDNPARAAGASGLSLPGNAAAQRHHGLRLAAARASPDGTRVSLDYLAVRPVSSSADAVPDGGVDHRSAAQFGRLAAAMPLDGRWKFGAETVVVGRYGATPGYGLTHLVLENSALDPRTTVSLHVYDVLDRHPADIGGSNALQPVSAAATPMPEGRGVRLALGVPF